MNVGHDPGDRLSAALFEYLHAGAENAAVSAEFVDDYRFYHVLLGRFQQLHRADELRENSAPVDVADQKDRGFREPCHAHIHNVVSLEVQLGGTSRAFDHDYVVPRG